MQPAACIIAADRWLATPCGCAHSHVTTQRQHVLRSAAHQHPKCLCSRLPGSRHDHVIHTFTMWLAGYFLNLQAGTSGKAAHACGKGVTLMSTHTKTAEIICFILSLRCSCSYSSVAAQSNTSFQKGKPLQTSPASVMS